MPISILTAEGLAKLLQKIKTVFATKTELNAMGEQLTSQASQTEEGLVHKTGNETIAGTKTFSSTISGSITGSSASCTGNAATATKATQDRNGLQIDTGYLKLSGGTLSGDISIAKNAPILSLKNNQVEINATTSQLDTRMNFYDKNDHNLSSVLTRTYADKSCYTYLRQFNFTSTNYGNEWVDLSIGYDKNGNAFANCPTPSSLTENSTKIATTAWVRTATGNFACNAATATNAGILSISPHTAMPTSTLDKDGIHAVEVYGGDSGYPCNYGNVINIQGASFKGAGQLLLGWSGSTNGIEHLYYRNKRDNQTTWSDWKTVAFTSDSITGNAATATTATTANALTTARTIGISGGATGTATSFNGSANITIPVTALDVSKASAGTLAVARGGTGLTSLDTFVRTTGAQTIADTKTFTAETHFLGTTPLIGFRFSEYTKGTNPTASRWSGIHFTDKTASTATNVRLGCMESNVTTAGQTAVYIRAYNWVASATTNASFAVVYPKNGTPYTETTALLRPTGNGTVSCGDASHRWSAVYAANATVQTSDERMKQDIADIPDAVLDAWDNVKWRQFKMKESVREKGASARLHSGIIAQEAAKALEGKSIDPSAYGFWCYDEWEEQEARLDSDGNVEVKAVPAGNQYSIRYEEALAIEAAYQRRRADRLEARIAALEAKIKD